jgi:hypothetical protein
MSLDTVVAENMEALKKFDIFVTHNTKKRVSAFPLLLKSSNHSYNRSKQKTFDRAKKSKLFDQVLNHKSQRNKLLCTNGIGNSIFPKRKSGCFK